MISINITNLSKKYLVGFKKNIVLKDINICITSEKCNFLLGYMKGRLKKIQRK